MAGLFISTESFWWIAGGLAVLGRARCPQDNATGTRLVGEPWQLTCDGPTISPAAGGTLSAHEVNCL